MTTPLRAGLGLALAGCLLTACGEPTPSAPGAPAETTTETTAETTAEAASACLVTADRLTELTGTAQTVEQSDVPGTRLYCETAVDARGVQMEWFLKEAGGNRPPTAQAQRRSLEASGMDVTEVDLGAERPGWLGQGPADLPRAQLVTVVGGGELYVNVLDTETGEATDDVGGDATGLAREVVAAGEAAP